MDDVSIYSEYKTITFINVLNIYITSLLFHVPNIISHE